MDTRAQQQTPIQSLLLLRDNCTLQENKTESYKKERIEIFVQQLRAGLFVYYDTWEVDQIIRCSLLFSRDRLLIKHRNHSLQFLTTGSDQDFDCETFQKLKRKKRLDEELEKDFTTHYLSIKDGVIQTSQYQKKSRGMAVDPPYPQKLCHGGKIWDSGLVFCNPKDAGYERVSRENTYLLSEIVEVLQAISLDHICTTGTGRDLEAREAAKTALLEDMERMLYVDDAPKRVLEEQKREAEWEAKIEEEIAKDAEEARRLAEDFVKDYDAIFQNEKSRKITLGMFSFNYGYYITESKFNDLPPNQKDLKGILRYALDSMTREKSKVRDLCIQKGWVSLECGSLVLNGNAPQPVQKIWQEVEKEHRLQNARRNSR